MKSTFDPSTIQNAKPRTAIAAGLLLLAAAIAQAQLAPDTQLISSEIIQRGPFHRVISQTFSEPDESGNLLTRVSTLTELGDGMHYVKDPNAAIPEWLPTRARFQVFDAALVANESPIQVILAASSLDEPLLDLLTPSGQRFKSSPRFIGIRNRLTQQGVVLAFVKLSHAVLFEENVVVYPDILDDGPSAALRCRLSPNSFEHDLVLLEDSDFFDPQIVGVQNPADATIELWSEVSEFPQHKVTLSELDNGLSDAHLDFGDTHIGPGRAFSNGDQEESIPVAKSWGEVDQSQWLIESIRLDQLQPLLEKLPKQAKAPAPKDRKARRLAKLHPTPAAMVAEFRAHAQAKAGEPNAQVAALARADLRLAPSVIWDWTAVTVNQTNYTFASDVTYYVSASCAFHGNAPGTTIEGGAVIKFSPTNNAKITIYSNLITTASTYLPIVLTARDDQSIGQPIVAANTLSNIYYSDVALELIPPAGSTGFDLRNIRVNHAKIGISLVGGSSNTVTHATFYKCQDAIKTTSSATLRARNILFNLVSNTLAGSSSTIHAEHFTVDAATNFNGGTSLTINLTNSLLAAVGTMGTVTSTNSNVTGLTPSATFTNVGSGSHYLANNSYRNLANSNVTIAAELKSLTTFAPIVLTNHFTANATLFPQAQRDTDALDLGWHAPPIDYCWSALTLTNATLNITPGCAIAFYGTKGTVLRSGSVFSSLGTVDAPVRLVKFDAVQELPQAWGTTGSTVSLLEVPATDAVPPKISLRFNEISFMGSDTGRRNFLSSAGYMINLLEMRDCQLRSAYQFLNVPSAGLTVGITNNLFERCGLYYFQTDVIGYGKFKLDARNNLYWRGAVDFANNSSQRDWRVTDCLFDTVTLTAGSGVITNSHNAYKSTTALPGGTSNITLYQTDYQNGPLGRYYYPNSGTNLFSLVNVGSRNSTNATLYHFGTQINLTKELSTTVDIGWHRPVTDANGVPIDWDLDTIPDHSEDLNNSGSVDSGETDWQSAGDLGLRVRITEPKPNSNLP